jgi:GntR family transcriptional regulator
MGIKMSKGVIMEYKLERDTPLPLYYQILMLLEAEIVSGSYKPGDYFSTEQDLQKKFKVSRATIRNALTILESRGLIMRVTGKGIFTTPIKLNVVLPNLLSFSEEMAKRGLEPSTKLLSVESSKAPRPVTQALQLGSTTKIICIRRIRMGDQIPIVYSVSYISANIGLTAKDDYSGSLYGMLHSRTGRPVVDANHKIEAEAASKEIAENLGVTEGFPLLSFTRLGYDPTGVPVVYETGVARSDMYSYDIRLKK